MLKRSTKMVTANVILDQNRLTLADLLLDRVLPPGVPTNNRCAVETIAWQQKDRWEGHDPSIMRAPAGRVLLEEAWGPRPRKRKLRADAVELIRNEFSCVGMTKKEAADFVQQLQKITKPKSMATTRFLDLGAKK